MVRLISSFPHFWRSSISSSPWEVILITTTSHTSTKTQSLPLIAWPMHIKYYPFLTFGSRTNTVTLFSITSTAGKEAFHTSVRGSILLWNQEEQDNGAWDRDEPWEAKPRFLQGHKAWCESVLDAWNTSFWMGKTTTSIADLPYSPLNSLSCISKL